MRASLILVGALAGLLYLVGGAGEASAYNYIHSCGPTWDLPVPYSINERGTTRIPDFGAVEMTLHQSFSTWGQPCCSDFQTSYQGTTTDSALNSDKEVVLSFSDTKWPAGFGGRYVIAVTIPMISQECKILSAPIMFNSFHFNFDLDGEEVDLQAVATHEVGHLLGLDHTQNISGVMFPHYMGGTSMRRLDTVDVDGVCSLYPKECICTGGEDCRDGEVCEDGMCVQKPCQSDEECGQGRVCESGGVCALPSCDEDDDCQDGLVCENERCLSACPACRVCERHEDCGSYGYCHPFEHGPRCMIVCGTEGRCPGDSVCQTVGEGEEAFSYCVSPEAEGEHYCPRGYICEGDASGLEACPGLGNDCRSETFDCTAANDRCLERSDGSYICSCTCLTDADCGERSRCIATEEGQACIPERQDPCEGVVCPSFEECYDGRCVDPMPEVDRVEKKGLFGCSASGGGASSALEWLVLLGTFVVVRRWGARFFLARD